MKQIMGVLVCALIAVGCGSDGDNGNGNGDGNGTSKSLPEHCNPLSSTSCLHPWPSTFYLRQDATTETGYRVNYPQQALPITAEGLPLEPARFNQPDGFSIGSQIIVTFDSGLLKQGLPTLDDLAASVTESSPIWIMEHDTGERVPLFAELDANAKTGEIPSLIIRPQVPMKFNSRYVVVIRTGLMDRQGEPLQPPEPFRRIRDGEEIVEKPLNGEKERIDQVLSFLEQQGVDRSDVVLAWDFHTASKGWVRGNLTEMVADALSRLPQDGPQVSEVTHFDQTASQDKNLLRQISGQMLVPSFLESDDPDSWLKLDERGRPVFRGMQKFPFWVHIPRCAETASDPLPVLILGHGMFASPRRHLMTTHQKDLINRMCMVEVAIQWLGMSEPDIPSIASDVMYNLSNLPRITDRVQQAHVNQQALVKMMQGNFLQHLSMQVGGKPVTDGKVMYYLGESMGGIQTTIFAALNPNIERYVNHVGGGWWSMIFQRSSNFLAFAVVLERVYPVTLDILTMISLSQHLFDYIDPINFVSMVFEEPQEGHVQKRILIQEALEDDRVPNLTTRAVARALGLTALMPAVEPVYGLEQKEGPLDSAYVQFKFPQTFDLPEGNVCPSPPFNAAAAHDMIRYQQSCINQTMEFLKSDGRAVHTCDGPCDPN